MAHGTDRSRAAERTITTTTATATNENSTVAPCANENAAPLLRASVR